MCAGFFLLKHDGLPYADGSEAPEGRQAVATGPMPFFCRNGPEKRQPLLYTRQPVDFCRLPLGWSG